MKAYDIIGKRFGYLIVLRFVGKSNHNARKFECQCDCGNKSVVFLDNLVRGHTISCGCKKTRRGTENNKYKHGLHKHPLYNHWTKMLERCYQPPNLYVKKRYQDRGIAVCDEWRNDFKAFFDWAVDNGWNDEKLPSGRYKLSLDRIDNDKGYYPSNCRWATPKMQSNNKSKKDPNSQHKIEKRIHIHYLKDGTIEYVNTNKEVV